jgi:beta-lactam-binding protein with PASTA domain
MRRFMGFLALLAVLALIAIAAVLIANSTSNTVVHYQKVIAKDAQSAVSQMRSIIDKYTK